MLPVAGLMFLSMRSTDMSQATSRGGGGDDGTKSVASYSNSRRRGSAQSISSYASRYTYGNNNNNNSNYNYNYSSGDTVASSRSRGSSYPQQQQQQRTEVFPVSPSSPLRRCLDDLVGTILPQSARLRVLTQAANEFDHKVRAHHDMELEAGAANVLLQKLAFVVVRSRGQLRERRRAGRRRPDASTTTTTARGRSRGGRVVRETGDGRRTTASGGGVVDRVSANTEREIALLCSCLEMVYRASDEAVGRSFRDIGSEMLPLLVEVTRRPLEGLLSTNDDDDDDVVVAHEAVLESVREDSAEYDSDPSRLVSKDARASVQKITKVLAAFSLVPEARREMAHCPNFLETLVTLLDTTNAHVVSSSGGGVRGANGVRTASSGAGLLVSEAARFHAVAVLTNLAQFDGNRMKMIAVPSLVLHVSRVATTDPQHAARRCASLAIVNLSDGDEQHIPDMTGHGYVIDALLHLLNRHRDLDDDDARTDTRRNAILSLYNICCSDINSDALARHDDGAVVETLLVETLGGNRGHAAHYRYDLPTTAAADDARLPIYERSTAAEILFHMSCSKNETTAVRMANHPGFLEGLASLLIGHDGAGTESYYAGSGRSLGAGDGAGAGVDVKMYAAATLRRVSEVVRNRALDAVDGDDASSSVVSPTSLHIVLVPLLSALVRGSGWVRTDCVAQGLMAQAEVERHRATMAEFHGLLNAVARLASNTTTSTTSGDADDATERIRSTALSILELLSTEERARTIMSRNEGVLMALTKASYEQENRERTQGDDATTASAACVKTALKNLVATI